MPKSNEIQTIQSRIAAAAQEKEKEEIQKIIRKLRLELRENHGLSAAFEKKHKHLLEKVFFEENKW